MPAEFFYLWVRPQNLVLGPDPSTKKSPSGGGDFLLVLVYGLELVVEADADDVVRAAVGVAT